VVTGESSSAERLRVAVAAYLARYRGLSRDHTGSDLRVVLAWCAERKLDPLAAQRAHLALYVRWCQEVRRFKPSTVPRRTSVVCGFYRTCVIDGLLEHSPAQWLRRPTVPAGVTHPRTDPPAVRGAAEHGTPLDQPQRSSRSFARRSWSCNRLPASPPVLGQPSCRGRRARNPWLPTASVRSHMHTPSTLGAPLQLAPTAPRRAASVGCSHLPGRLAQPVPQESPTLGAPQLQFEALLSAGRDSAKRQRPRPRGKARAARPAHLPMPVPRDHDVGEEHGHGVLPVVEVGPRHLDMEGARAIGAERNRLWREVVLARAPSFASYERSQDG
jgi:hypothetical protein